MTSCLAILPVSYLVRNTPMKSVFRPLQVSNIEKATLDVKREARSGIGAAQAKTYTKPEREPCSLRAMMHGGTCEAHS